MRNDELIDRMGMIQDLNDMLNRAARRYRTTRDLRMVDWYNEIRLVRDSLYNDRKDG